jgi:hypothetical protein
MDGSSASDRIERSQKTAHNTVQQHESYLDYALNGTP